MDHSEVCVKCFKALLLMYVCINNYRNIHCEVEFIMGVLFSALSQ